MKIPLTQHSISRDSMYWTTKDGLVKLSQLTDNHLKNIKKHILQRVNTHPEPQSWNGFSWEAWIFSIRAEQDYRRGLVDNIFNKLGKTGQELIQKAYSKEIEV